MTTSPSTSRRELVAPCDNLVLMRMTSVGDLGYDTLSWARPGST